eukprot:g8038.t1
MCNLDYRLHDYLQSVLATYSAQDHWTAFCRLGSKREAYLCDHFPIPVPTETALNLVSTILRGHDGGSFRFVRDFGFEVEDGEALDATQLVSVMTGHFFCTPLSEPEEGAFQSFCALFEQAVGEQAAELRPLFEQHRQGAAHMTAVEPRGTTGPEAKSWTKFDHRSGKRVELVRTGRSDVLVRATRQQYSFDLTYYDLLCCSEALFHLWRYVGCRIGTHLASYDAIDAAAAAEEEPSAEPGASPAEEESSPAAGTEVALCAPGEE